MSALALPAHRPAAPRPAVMAVLLLGAAALVSAALIGPSIMRVLSQPASGFDVERMLLLYASLPRLVTSLLCGAALAASGCILQQVMRNPLAAPETLGISAGANLALALAGVYAPQLLGIGRDLVALAGSAVAVALVFGLVRRQDFAPVPLVLAGLIVGLYCGALSAILVLMNEGYLVSLFIWGGGSLSLQDWSVPSSLALRLAVLAPLAVLLVRPLALLDIDDDGARALGLPVGVLRMIAVAVAVTIAALVVSAVGVIGFIGLVAPTLARLSGARSFRSRLLFSTLIGAGLLWLTDGAVQAVSDASGDFLPTGAVTALFGSPLLLWLLPRLRFGAQPRGAGHRPSGLPFTPGKILAGLAILLLLMLVVALFLGRGPAGGWTWLGFADWSAVSPWRLPRTVAAFAAAAMLAAAGTLMQRMTGNEMASPELLGIGAGATLGVALSLFVFTGLGLLGQTAAAFAGAIAVFVGILAFGRRSGFTPERVLLAGVALSALADAVVGALSASGDPRALLLLAWMGGSTYTVDAARAAQTLALSAVLIAAAALTVRWLELLPLGETHAKALGLPLGRSRLVLLVISAALTAIATPIVGPFSFVGLMGPHLARALGLRRPLAILAGAALAGGTLMVAADFAARMVMFPWQVPTGLTAALIGAPFLLWLLQRRRA